MQVLGLLVKTKAPDETYPVLNSDISTIPTQMQLSKRKQTFSQFLAALSIPSLNFKHFEKKDHPPRLCISENTGSGNVVR